MRVARPHRAGRSRPASCSHPPRSTGWRGGCRRAACERRSGAATRLHAGNNIWIIAPASQAEGPRRAHAGSRPGRHARRPRTSLTLDAVTTRSRAAQAGDRAEGACARTGLAKAGVLAAAHHLAAPAGGVDADIPEQPMVSTAHGAPACAPEMTPRWWYAQLGGGLLPRRRLAKRHRQRCEGRKRGQSDGIPAPCRASLAASSARADHTAAHWLVHKGPGHRPALQFEHDCNFPIVHCCRAQAEEHAPAPDRPKLAYLPQPSASQRLATTLMCLGRRCSPQRSRRPPARPHARYDTRAVVEQLGEGAAAAGPEPRMSFNGRAEI